MPELTVTIGFFCLLASLLAVCGILAWSLRQTQSQLMWFHKAGQSMAQHQLDLARIDVEKQMAIAKTAEAEAMKARAEAQMVGSTNGNPTRFGSNRVTRTPLMEPSSAPVSERT